MERYRNNVQDGFGNAIPSVTVTVRRVSDGGLASIFSDNGVTGKANPFTNDSDGEFFFYASDDRYNIFFTGPITDQTDDVLLFDGAVSGASAVLTDINTATPPTTEAVSGTHKIRDADDTDMLAELGYFANPHLTLINRMHGGRVDIQAENAAAGTIRTIMEADPDTNTRLRGFSTITLEVGIGELALQAITNGQVELYHDNNIRLITQASGRIILKSTGNTDTEGRVIEFQTASGGSQAIFGWETDNVMRWRQKINGAPLEILAEDAGGVPRTVLLADGDATTTLRADTNLLLESAAGKSAIVGTADADTAMFFNDVEKMRTADETATDQVSGGEILDGEGNFQPVGIGVSPQQVISTTGTHTPFTQARVGLSIEFTQATAANIDTFTNVEASQTAIPNGSMWFGKNDGAGALTFRGGTGVVVHFFDASGAPADQDVTIPRGSVFCVHKINDSRVDIFGKDLT